MPTKIILNGGNTERKSEMNRNFFQEIVGSVEKQTVKILCVYFAHPSHRWEESFETDINIFLSLNTPKKLDITMAIDPETFAEDVASADVIFLAGGMRGNLKQVLLSVDFPKLIKNKVVVGISAGANVLSKYYWSSAANEIRQGIGLLPIKLFCHFSEVQSSELAKLEAFELDLPTYKIPEETFEIIEID